MLRQSRQWRDGLEKEYELVTSNYEIFTNHTRWVLVTAMEEANLLGPEKPLPAILVRQEEFESDEHKIHEGVVSEDGIENTGRVLVLQNPGISVESDDSDFSQNPGDLERREAYDDFVQLDIQNYQD